MLDLDDDASMEVGLCGDYLPQFFEIVEGSVRIRGDESEAAAGHSLAEGSPPRSGAPRP